MNSLFIIGNGFDLLHGLKTSYENFHEYLKKEHPNAKLNDWVPQYTVDGHGNDVPESEDEVIGFIENMLCDVDGEKWSDLELSIGKIDFKNYISSYENDEEDDNDLLHETYFNEDNAINLKNTILEIPSYFSQWISTIEINNVLPKEDFISIINEKKDLFLSFNYTKVLEELYGAKNVCHIHGVQGEKLLFGHGQEYNYFSEENYGMLPGTEESFQKIHDELKKDTQKALESNKTFFQMMNTVNKIYSYGFSFSEVDKVYIKEICNSLDTQKVTWYLNDFDDKHTRKKYKRKIRECGFKGSFDTYNIKN